MWPRLPRCLFFAQDPGGPWLKFKKRHAHRRGRGAAHGHVTDVVGRLRVVRRSAASRPGWLRQRRVGGAGGKTKARENEPGIETRSLFAILCRKFRLFWSISNWSFLRSFAFFCSCHSSA